MESNRTVWVVYYVGNFESYVAGIFSTEEKAKKFVKDLDDLPVYKIYEEKVI